MGFVKERSLLLFSVVAFLGLAAAAPAQAEGAEEWMSAQVRSGLLASGILLVVVYLLQGMLIRHAAAMTLDKKQADFRRRLIVGIRNGAVGLIILGLVVIWASELRAVAISLVAITAAIVIATKELILCLSGGLYRTVMGECRIGDRVEINGIRGDVIDTTLLSTTILEIGPGQLTHQHTGRAVVIPNGVLLASPVYNETFTRDFVAHTFQIPLGAKDDWEKAEAALLAAANAEVAEFLEESRRHMTELRTSTGLDVPYPDPRVLVRIPEPEKILLVVRITVPPSRRGRVEQAIMRNFLRQYRGAMKKQESEEKPKEAT